MTLHRGTTSASRTPAPRLLGLAFVAISFDLDAIIADKVLPGRAVETLTVFAYPLTWRLNHATPGCLLASLAVIAALATTTTSIGGLYWLGGAMAVATSAGLINSWVPLVEIKR